MRQLRRIVLFVAILFGLPFSSAVGQDVFYAASGSNGVAGSLYSLNPANGAATLVGALTDGTNNYGMTGLAFQPGSNILFGATANASPTAAGSLVTINPNTGVVTQIGAFGVGAMSDITFAPNGTLYGWHAAGDHSLYTINPATGVATLVAATSPNPGFGGGSLASDANGIIWSTPNSSSNPPGTLQTVSPVTGQLTLVANLSNAPLISGTHTGGMVIDASDFGSNGLLYGLNTDEGSPAATHLVTINTATGVISDIGATLAGDLDGLAIFHGVSVPEPNTWALIGVSGVIVSAGYCWCRRRARSKDRGWNPTI